MANKKGSGQVAAKSSSSGSHTSKQQQLSNDYKDYSSLKIVLFYCSLIVFLPVGTFFVLKTVLLDNFLQLTPVKSNIYSAVGAIIMLHLALGLYIYRAYFGDSESSKKSD